MKLKYSQKGLAMVEATIVLSLFLVLMFGIMELGLVMFDKAVITNASREAARSGIVLRSPVLTVTAIQAVANNYCGTHVIGFKTGETCTVTATKQAADAYGIPLNVTVTYNYYYSVFGDLLKLLPKGTFPYPLVLSATTTMYME